MQMHFKTSYVNVNHKRLGKDQVPKRISKHLMLMLIGEGAGCSRAPNVISKHLMLMLIVLCQLPFPSIRHFKTSYVNVNRMRLY